MTPVLVKAAADYTSIPAKTIMSKSRERYVCYTRFALMWVIRSEIGLSLLRIAEELGLSDHSTVINGLKRAEDLMKKSEAFRNLVEHLSDIVLKEAA